LSGASSSLRTRTRWNALYEDGRRIRLRAGYAESLFLVSDTLDIGYGELTLDGRFKVSGPLTLSGTR